MNMSLMELYHSMGWFAKGIVFTLLGMSAFSFRQAIHRALSLRNRDAWGLASGLSSSYGCRSETLRWVADRTMT